MLTIKILFIDDRLRFINDFLEIGRFLPNDEAKYCFEVEYVKYCDNNEPDLFEEQRKIIENNIVNGINVLILDICLSTEEEIKFSDFYSDTSVDISGFTSLRLASSFSENKNLLILFTSSMDNCQTVHEFRRLKERVQLFTPWNFIPKPFKYCGKLIDIQRCPQICGEAKTFDENAPCNSLQCVFWRLSYLYDNHNNITGGR